MRDVNAKAATLSHVLERILPDTHQSQSGLSVTKSQESSGRVQLQD